MSERLVVQNSTGRTSYVVIRNESAQVWNGSAFANFSAGSWSTYAVALVEQGATGYFSAQFPGGITTEGVYSFVAYDQIGGSATITDTVIGVGSITVAGSVDNDAIAEAAAALILEDPQTPLKNADGNVTIGDLSDEAIATLRAAFAAGSIVVTSPIKPNSGAIEIYAGDIYNDDLTWTITDAALPDLDGATATVRMLKAEKWRKGDDDDQVVFSAELTSLTATSFSVKLPLSAAQTAALATAPPQDRLNYRLFVVVQGSGWKRTFVDCPATVIYRPI